MLLLCYCFLSAAPLFQGPPHSPPAPCHCLPCHCRGVSGRSSTFHLMSPPCPPPPPLISPPPPLLLPPQRSMPLPCKLLVLLSHILMFLSLSLAYDCRRHSGYYASNCLSSSWGLHFELFLCGGASFGCFSDCCCFGSPCGFIVVPNMNRDCL